MNAQIKNTPVSTKPVISSIWIFKYDLEPPTIEKFLSDRRDPDCEFLVERPWDYAC